MQNALIFHTASPEASAKPAIATDATVARSVRHIIHFVKVTV